MDRNVDVRQTGLGKRLARLRNEAGLSKQELAERARVTFNTINDLEKGRRPRAMEKTLQSIALALGVTYEYFTYGHEPLPPVDERPAQSGRERWRSRAFGLPLTRDRLITGALAVAALAVLAVFHARWERDRDLFAFQCVLETPVENRDWVRFEDLDGDGMIEIIHGSNSSGVLHVCRTDRTDPDRWTASPLLIHNYEDNIQVTTYVHDVNGDGWKDLFNVCRSGNTTRIEVMDSRSGKILKTFAGIEEAVDRGAGAWHGEQSVEAVQRHPTSGDEMMLVRTNANSALQPRNIRCLDLATGREVWRFGMGADIHEFGLADVDCDGHAELFVLCPSTARGVSLNGTTDMKAYIMVIETDGTLKWRSVVAGEQTHVSACLLSAGPKDTSYVFAAIDSRNESRRIPSKLLLLDAESGARLDSLYYADFLVNEPLAHRVPGRQAWDVYFGTQHGMMQRYRVEGGRIHRLKQRSLFPNWVSTASFVASDSGTGPIVVATPGDICFLLDHELDVVSTRSGPHGAPVTPLASFADPEGRSYVAFSCREGNMCIDRVVGCSAWGGRLWYAMGYLVLLLSPASVDVILRRNRQGQSVNNS